MLFESRRRRPARRSYRAPQYRCKSARDVNVNGAAAVPAGIDGGELHLTALVGDLVAAQELLSAGINSAGAAARVIGAFVGINALRVAVPDIDVGACKGSTAPLPRFWTLIVRVSGMPARATPVEGSVRMSERKSFSSTQ